MDGEYKFRPSLAGFNRSEVLEYIGKLQQEYHAFRVESEKTIAELRRQLALLQEEKASMCTDVSQVCEQHNADAESVPDVQIRTNEVIGLPRDDDEVVPGVDDNTDSPVPEKSTDGKTPEPEADKPTENAYTDGYDFSRAMDMLIAEYGE